MEQKYLDKYIEIYGHPPGEASNDEKIIELKRLYDLGVGLKFKQPIQGRDGGYIGGFCSGAYKNTYGNWADPKILGDIVESTHPDGSGENWTKVGPAPMKSEPDQSYLFPDEKRKADAGEWPFEESPHSVLGISHEATGDDADLAYRRKLDMLDRARLAVADFIKRPVDPSFDYGANVEGCPEADDVSF